LVIGQASSHLGLVRALLPAIWRWLDSNVSRRGRSSPPSGDGWIPTSPDGGALHRPPPAQAQAQAQPAQAQAHEEPPLLLKLRAEGGGGGLVVRVTPLVKSVMLPTAPAAKVSTPLTMLAANSEPGRVGIAGLEDLPPEPGNPGLGAGARPTPGS
jgi:hypothetical protein